MRLVRLQRAIGLCQLKVNSSSGGDGEQVAAQEAGRGCREEKKGCREEKRGRKIKEKKRRQKEEGCRKREKKGRRKRGEEEEADEKISGLVRSEYHQHFFFKKIIIGI